MLRYVVAVFIAAIAKLTATVINFVIPAIPECEEDCWMLYVLVVSKWLGV